MSYLQNEVTASSLLIHHAYEYELLAKRSHSLKFADTPCIWVWATCKTKSQPQVCWYTMHMSMSYLQNEVTASSLLIHHAYEYELLAKRSHSLKFADTPCIWVTKNQRICWIKERSQLRLPKVILNKTRARKGSQTTKLEARHRILIKLGL